MTDNLKLRNTKLKYIFVLLFIKALYVYLNVLMLPEYWVASYSFDRNITLDYLVFEIIVYVLCMVVYLRYLKPGHPISFAISIYFCLYVIPSNSCLVLNNYSALYYISINAFNILLLWLLGKSIDKKSNNEIENGLSDQSLDANTRLQKTFRFLTVFTCLGVIIYVYYMRGSLSLDGIFSEDIYETRAIVSELYLDNTDSALAYIMTFWKAFYSTILIIGLYNSIRKGYYIDTILCVYSYLLLFSFEMQKSALFRPFIALFIYYLYRSKQFNKNNLYLLNAYCVIYLFSLVEYLIAQQSVIYTLVIRRVAYMPQYLAHAYYDFFSNNDKLWLSRDFFQLEKIVRLFYPSSYEHGAVWVMAENCFPGIPSPNTGLFGEAFSQMGYIGILVFPPIYTLIIRFYYKYSMVFGRGASSVLLSSFVLSMINIQVLATRGVLMVLLFVIIAFWVKKVSKV